MLRILVLTCLLSSWNSYATELVLYTHSSQNESFLNEQKALRGLDGGGHRALLIELVHMIATKVNQPWNLTHIPYIRGIRELQNKNNIVFFNVIPRDQNKDSLKWVGPVMPITFSLYESIHSPLKITSIDDAQKANYICILRGTLVEQTLQKRGFTNLFIHSSYKNCVNMLIKGRVDLIVLPNLSVYQQLITTGLYGTEVRMTAVDVLKEQGYIAFSKEIPDHVINQWQESLNKVLKSTEYSLLTNKMLPKKH